MSDFGEGVKGLNGDVLIESISLSLSLSLTHTHTQTQTKLTHLSLSFTHPTFSLTLSPTEPTDMHDRFLVHM